MDGADQDANVAGTQAAKRPADDELVGVRKKRAVAPAEQEAPTPPPDPAAASADGAPATSAPTAEPVSAGEEAEEGRDDGSDSDSDSDSSEDFGGLATDREDRKRLREMPELEREMELEKREEQREKIRFRQMLSRRDEPKEKKKAAAARPRRPARKAAAAAPAILDDAEDDDDDDDDFASGEEGVRRSARSKTVGAKATKMDALADMRANRERAADASASAGDSEDGLTAGQRERAAARRRETVASSSSSGSGSEGEERAARAAARTELSDEEASDLSAGEDEGAGEAPQEDVMRMQVKRGDLEDWMKQPHMRDTLLGAVVRVALGRRAEDVVATYSMCLVHDIEDGKQYTFHGVSSTFETDKYLVIVDAADQRQHTISFALVSNADLRPEEFDRFHESRSSNVVCQITNREAADVVVKLQAARNYTLSSEDIGRIVREKREKGLVKRSLAHHKAELILALNAAREVGDTDAEARASADLAKVMQQVREQREQDNRESNPMLALNRKAKMENRARAHAKAKADGASGSKVAGYDPYSRKATKVVQYWSTGRKGEGETAAAKADANGQAAQAKLTPAQELAGLHLATSTGTATPGSILARRLLGPQYRFTCSTQLDRTNKQVISLAAYQDKIRARSYSQLGLDL